MSELTKALVAARQALGPTVRKSGWNESQRFAYVGAEQVVKATRDALLGSGLTLVQSSVEFKQALPFRTSKGETQCWLWEGSFVLEHVSGESRTYRFSGTTQCNDKAAWVASTALDRTALLRVLGLAGSADEDPEHNSHDVDQGTGETQASQQGALPAQQQAPADQWQQEDAGVVLARLKSDAELMLAHIKTKGSEGMEQPLVDWATELGTVRTKSSKSEHWALWGKACEAAGFNPQELHGKAKSAAQAGGAK